jgi:serine/threonine kinase 16
MSSLYTILHHLRSCLNSLLSLFFSNQAFFKNLTFDNGIQVRIGKQIAEGGFSFVFEAIVISDGAAVNTVTHSSHGGQLALKRINCPDHELLQSCREEAGIHRSLPKHDNLLELLGLKFERDSSSNEYNVCYMLFPYIPTSLRGEMTERNILQQSNSRQRPFATKEILSIFGGILDGLSTMHSNNISHRDVKIENVLLKRGQSYRDGHRSTSGYTPVLMDFGSAGPLTIQFNSRHEVLSAIETASQHTTLSYRPPELFEGGLRHNDGTKLLDYGKVDVWSVGCVLFGLMHGCSPFEMEFVRSNSPYDSDGVRIVDCTHLKILGEVPYPPWVKQSGIAKQPNNGYPIEIYDFVRFMVCHDRRKRPDIQQVRTKFGDLHMKLTGTKWTSDGGAKRQGGNDDFDSLIANRDFV